MRLKVIGCLVVILCFLSGSVREIDALGNVSLEGAGVVVDLEFPEEAHPTETITLNLTVTAQVGLKLQNFTLIIEVLLGTDWQQVYKEQVLQLNMVQNDSLARLVWFTLPQNAQGTLRCYINVQTDKAPGLPLTYVFYTTQIRTMTYDELQGNYSELQANYSNLRTDYTVLLNSYDALSTKYDGLNSTYNALLATFESLNSSYFTQQANYDILKANYTSLEASYKALNQTYYSLKAENDRLNSQIASRDAELTLTRTIVYALIGVIAALVALAVYLRKSEPYVVLRKETVSVKPKQAGTLCTIHLKV